MKLKLRGPGWPATRSSGVRRAAILLAAMAALIGAPEARAEALVMQQLAEGVTLEILELRRINKKVLQMTFAIINDTEEDVNSAKLGVAYGDSMTVIQLLDMKNLQRYDVGRGGQGYCLCSRGDLIVPAEGRRDYYAHYAAPPAKVKALAIQFPVLPPIYDVPIAE